MIGKIHVFALAAFFLTFGVFFATSIRDGAALSGKITQGHYYIGQHSNYKEVSRSSYVFSATLTALVGLELPIAAWAGIWHESQRKKQPIWHPVYAVGLLLSALVGIGFLCASVGCILAAFSGA